MSPPPAPRPASGSRYPGPPRSGAAIARAQRSLPAADRRLRAASGRRGALPRPPPSPMCTRDHAGVLGQQVQVRHDTAQHGEGGAAAYLLKLARLFECSRKGRLVDSGVAFVKRQHRREDRLVRRSPERLRPDAGIQHGRRH